MHRTILHVDMDAFYASVEQRDHPEYRGKPVVVGAPPDKRGVVSAASYEARKFGIHSAMPSREAGRLCPQAIFVPPDMHLYGEVSRQIHAVFERFTPLVEPLSVDEAFLDVTGSSRMFGPGPEIARRVKETIHRETALTASVGVACNKFLAKLASDLEKPDGLTVVPSDPQGIRRFLAPMPVSRLWGVGKVSAGILHQAGLLTIGDIQTTSRERLVRLLGDPLAGHILPLALGQDDRPVVTEWEAKSLSREHTFDTDCSNPTTVEQVLLDLVDDVGRQLRADGRYACVAQIKVRWDTFQTLTRQKRIRPCCDDHGLRTMAQSLLQAIPLERPVRLIGFGVQDLTSLPPTQMDLFDAPPAKILRRERLSRAVDAIRTRYGSGSIRRPQAPT